MNQHGRHGELSAIRVHNVNEDIQIDLVASPSPISSIVKQKVDGIWAAALSQPDLDLFEGTVLSATDIRPDRMTVQRQTYSAFYAQSREPSLFESLRIRPLACSGLTRCADGVVFAKRSVKMFLEPGKWELAPSGTLDHQSIEKNNSINPKHSLQRELQEELGIGLSQAEPGRILGLFEHLDLGSVDIAIEINTSLSHDQIMQCFEKNENDEYSDIAIVPERSIDNFLRKTDEGVVPASLKLLEHLGLV